MKKSLIDLLNFLSFDENSKFLPQSKHFNYKRGNKMQVEVELEKDEKVNFEVEYNPNGYSFEYLTFSREKANVSIRVRYDGTAKLPPNDFGMKTVSTYIYRAYNIIRDGKVVVEKLPVIASTSLLSYLDENGIKYEYDNDSKDMNFIIIDLLSLPVITNDNSVEVTSSRLAKLEAELIFLQSTRKYIKSLFDENAGKGTFTHAMEVENWLKSIGITSYNGYVQQTEEIDSEDSASYKIKTLKTKISSLSNIPSLSAVAKKVESGKSLTPSEAILKQVSDIFEEFSNEELDGLKGKEYDQKRKELVKLKNKEIEAKIQAKIFQISQIVFVIVTSNSWFTDKNDFKDNQTEIDINGNIHTVTFELQETEIEI